MDREECPLLGATPQMMYLKVWLYRLGGQCPFALLEDYDHLTDFLLLPPQPHQL